MCAFQVFLDSLQPQISKILTDLSGNHLFCAFQSEMRTFQVKCMYFELKFMHFIHFKHFKLKSSFGLKVFLWKDHQIPVNQGAEIHMFLRKQSIRVQPRKTMHQAMYCSNNHFCFRSFYNVFLQYPLKSMGGEYYDIFHKLGKTEDMRHIYRYYKKNLQAMAYKQGMEQARLELFLHSPRKALLAQGLG